MTATFTGVVMTLLGLWLLERTVGGNRWGGKTNVQLRVRSGRAGFRPQAGVFEPRPQILDRLSRRAFLRMYVLDLCLSAVDAQPPISSLSGCGSVSTACWRSR